MLFFFCSPVFVLNAPFAPVFHLFRLSRCIWGCVQIRGKWCKWKIYRQNRTKTEAYTKKRTISTSSAKRRHIDKRAENCPIFTVNIPDWRLRKQHTYSINFYLNVNKCQPASILESPLAPNSCRYHSYKSRHAENTLRAVVAMDLVSENGLIIQTKWVSNWI